MFTRHRSNLERETNITEGVIWKQLLAFFFPILLGTFFQQLYNTADAMIVGRFVGKEALAAVGGATGNLINLLVGFFVGLASGATVIISQFYGGHRDEDVSKAVHTAAAMALGCGALLTVVGIVLSPMLLRMMGTPEDVMDYALTYMRIYFAGMIPNLIYNIGSGVLRAVGDSRRPLYFLIAACLTNIVLDVVFVLYLHMGVAGAAYATVGGQILSMIVGLCILFFGNHAIALEFKGFRFHGKTMKDIYVVGLPSIVMNAIGTLMTMAMNGILAGFSAVAVNVFGVYFKLQSFVFMPVFGLTQGLMPIMGYNYGARNKKRVTGAVKIGCVIALIIEIAGLIVFEICPGTLISIFNATPELHEIGDSALRIIAIHFPMAAIGITLSTLFQATGHGMYSLVQSVMRQLVVLVPAAWLLSRTGNLDLVWLAFPIAELMSLTLSSIFLRKTLKRADQIMAQPVRR